MLKSNSWLIIFYELQWIVLTRRSKFIRILSQEALPGDVGDGAQHYDGAHEAGLLQHHALVRRELADAVRQDHLVPMLLEHLKGMLYICIYMSIVYALYNTLDESWQPWC